MNHQTAHATAHQHLNHPKGPSGPNCPNWMKKGPRPQTILSAALIVAAFPPWGAWPLIWVALIPWIHVLKKARTYREATLQGFWLCYLMSFLGFYWVAAVLQEFGNLPWILSVLGHQVFCLFGQLQFIIFAPLFKFLDKSLVQVSDGNKSGIKSLGLICFLSASYTAVDWLTPKLFMDTLGHTLFPAQYLRQIADLGGAPLLTFLVFATNWTLWKIGTLLQFRFNISSINHTLGRHALARSFPWVLPWITNLSLLLGLAWGYGYFRYHEVRSLVNESSTHLQAAAIQGNIGDFDKVAAERGVVRAAYKIIETYTQMTDEALQLKPKPDLVIWPETAYPSTFRTPQTTVEMQLDDTMESYVVSRQVPLLFGGYDRFQMKDYNSFFFLNPNGSLRTYHKNKLLLFGEYLPGAETFPFIKETFPQVGNFGRGVGPEVLSVDVTSTNPSVGSVLIAPIICYEALFPDYVLSSTLQGSQLILNITNDSWFGFWGEPQLHVALSIFRSIENRIPMLRATNTGVSALILPDGEITSPTPLGVPRILNVSIPLNKPIPTRIKEWGHWFGPFCLIWSVVGLGFLMNQSSGSHRRFRAPNFLLTSSK